MVVEMTGMDVVMTDKQRALLKAIIRDHTVRTTRTVEEAKASLIDEGIITQDGELTVEYGGSKAA